MNKESIISKFLKSLGIKVKPIGSGFSIVCNKCNAENVQTTVFEWYVKGETELVPVLLKCLKCGEADYKEYEPTDAYG